MINIEIENIIREKCPNLRIAAIECDIINSESNSGLWDEIDSLKEELLSEYKIENINEIPAIQATRKAYKILGKEPNRYRPSAEALFRRVMRNIPIYRINTAVDLINLISLKTGYSIGGIGTPTSDEERTKLQLSSSRLLMIINAYSGNEGLEEAVELSENLLRKYCRQSTINAFRSILDC